MSLDTLIHRASLPSPQVGEAQALQWLQSPQLRDVVALALSNNRDLRVAVENIEKARAQYGITRADLLPGITAQAQGNRTRSAADLTTTGRSTINEQYTAQLGFASYELDLWGRIRNLSEASLQQFLLSQENQRNVQISLVADVSNAWLTLAADQARLQLAKDTLDSRIKAFELTRKMYELGSTSGLVLAQNQTTVDTARGDVASYTSQVDRDRNALQLLVGGPVPAPLLPTAQTLMNGAGNGIESGGDVAALKAVPVPLPSTVLLKRPDVQAAERNLQAMNANIGAARAAMFPSITLTGSIGTGSSDLTTQVLTLGKRLSERLYLSYEQGIEDASQIVKLTYQLSRRWSVVARAGTDNAVDLFYTLYFDTPAPPPERNPARR